MTQTNIDLILTNLEKAIDDGIYGCEEDSVLDTVKFYVDHGALNDPEFTVKSWHIFSAYLDSTTCHLEYEFSSHTGLYDNFAFVMDTLLESVLVGENDSDQYNLLRLLSRNFTLEKCIRYNPEKMCQLLNIAYDECWGYEYMFLENPDALSVKVPEKYSTLFDKIRKEVEK